MKPQQDSQVSFSGGKANRSQIFPNPQSNSPPIGRPLIIGKSYIQEQQVANNAQTKPAIQTRAFVAESSTQQYQARSTQQKESKVYNPKFQFNAENTPRVVCHYHHDQFVTLFCRHPSCYMPLCPQCIKIHSQEHQQFGSHGQYDTLDNCLNEAHHKLSSYCNRFTEEIQTIKQNQGSTGDGSNEQMDKLRKARQQAYSAIDTFFNTIEQELSQELQSNHQFLSEQSTNFTKYLETRQRSLSSFLDKLNSDKCVKNLIKYYCQDVEQDNDLYFKESQNFMKQFKQSTPHIIVDQPSIYQLCLDLAKFVTLKKGQSVMVKKQFEPFETQPQQSIDQNNKQGNNIYLTQSPIQVSNYPPSMLKDQRSDGLENRPPVEEIHPYLRTPPKTQQPLDVKQYNNSTNKQNPPIFYPQSRQGQY